MRSWNRLFETLKTLCNEDQLYPLNEPASYEYEDDRYAVGFHHGVIVLVKIPKSQLSDLEYVEFDDLIDNAMSHKPTSELRSMVIGGVLGLVFDERMTKSVCPECSGTGGSDKSCEQCGGTGKDLLMIPVQMFGYVFNAALVYEILRWFDVSDQIIIAPSVIHVSEDNPLVPAIWVFNDKWIAIIAGLREGVESTKDIDVDSISIQLGSVE